MPANSITPASPARPASRRGGGPCGPRRPSRDAHGASSPARPKSLARRTPTNAIAVRGRRPGTERVAIEQHGAAGLDREQRPARRASAAQRLRTDRRQVEAQILAGPGDLDHAARRRPRRRRASMAASVPSIASTASTLPSFTTSVCPMSSAATPRASGQPKAMLPLLPRVGSTTAEHSAPVPAAREASSRCGTAGCRAFEVIRDRAQQCLVAAGALPRRTPRASASSRRRLRRPARRVFGTLPAITASAHPRT